MGIRREIIISSSLKTDGRREDKIIEVCKALKADELYDSKAAASFLDVQEFREHGIRLLFQNYNHPVYAQLHSPFVPFMSSLDLLFNHGAQSSEIILSGSNNAPNRTL